jgi:hypothetical protein
LFGRISPQNDYKILEFFEGQVMQDFQAKNSTELTTGTLMELEKKKHEEAQIQLFQSNSKVQEMLEPFKEICVWLWFVNVASRGVG